MTAHTRFSALRRCLLGVMAVVGASAAAYAQAPAAIVIHSADTTEMRGTWQKVADSGAASGIRLWHPNANTPKVTQASAFAPPVSYVEFGFVADPTLEYKLWVRLKAKNDYWGNDSVWVQFSGAVDASGSPVFRTGTTSGLAVNLEECANCGLSQWGWRDDMWGAAGGMSSTYLRFPEGGIQSMRIQTREDGVSIDNIVLSARKYKAIRPGAVKNDTTKLPHNALFGS